MITKALVFMQSSHIMIINVHWQTNYPILPEDPADRTRIFLTFKIPYPPLFVAPGAQTNF